MAWTLEEMAPGVAQTERDAGAALGPAMAASDARQADAGRFIREHGGQVVGGHADVGDGSADRGRRA